MKQRYTLLLLILMFGAWQHLEAQKYSRFPSDPNTPFDPYFAETRDTVSLYGPHTITRNIVQDKTGAYWLTTWQGIIRYDGQRFTNITLKEGLIHFHVNSAFEDKAGNLWFGTVRGGLYRYDGQSFKLFTTKDGLADNNVDCMLEDDEGNLWLAGDSGVTRFDGNHFIRFRKKEGLTNSYVNCMMKDKKGRLWFGAADGLYVFSGISFTSLTRENGQPFSRVWSLAEDRNGNVLIGGAGGLCRYDGHAFTDLKTEPTTFMSKDRSGNILLSASETNPESKMQARPVYQALYRYDGSSFTKLTEKNEAGDFQIFGPMEDRGGDIWFGSMKGLCRYDGKTVKHFTKD